MRAMDGPVPALPAGWKRFRFHTSSVLSGLGYGVRPLNQRAAPDPRQHQVVTFARREGCTRRCGASATATAATVQSERGDGEGWRDGPTGGSCEDGDGASSGNLRVARR